MVFRLTVLTCALLFGLPAAALLLAHMGFIALPADAYLSSVSTTSAPVASSSAQVLTRYELDGTSPRTAPARAAIMAANELLPGHERGLNRYWTFHRNGSRRNVTNDLVASTTVCDGCASGAQILFVSANVDRIHEDIADVVLHWSLHSTQRVYDNRGRLISAGKVEDSGEIMMRLQFGHGRWRAVPIE
jgi:hypothetical protein